MHMIEPFFGWRELYRAEDDPSSPFYQRIYNEFYFEDKIYDHYIHPQWDNIESSTLFIKILFANYDSGYAFIELIGEWNDTIHNDIMILKRNIIEELTYAGINKFVLIGENVLNFHYSDDCYYEEWFDDIEDGWIVALGFLPHVQEEMKEIGIDHYFIFGKSIDELDWSIYKPDQLFAKVSSLISKRLI